MFMPQEHFEGPCDTCHDTGRHPMKRKKRCPDCGDNGGIFYCARCHLPTTDPSHEQIIGGIHCTNEPRLVADEPALPIFRVCENGSRELVRMANLKDGDIFHVRFNV